MDSGLAAVKEAHALLEGIIEGSPEFIIAIDHQYRVIAFNSAAKDLMKKRGVGELKLGFDASNDPYQLTPWWTRALQGERFFVDFKDLGPNSITHYYQCGFSPIKNASGVIIGGALIGRNVTEEKIKELEFIEQQKILANTTKFTALGEMAAGIAHEINNPLAIIQSQLALLQTCANQGDLEGAKLNEGLTKALRTVDRITKIVKGLRVLARDSADDAMDVISVKKIIENTVDICQDRLKSKGIGLKITQIPDTIQLKCHSVQISQVLLNLIVNSMQAIEQLSEKWISIEVHESFEKIIIEVIDSGRGIPSDLREKIFKTFFTTKGVGIGTGLGLSISKGIIEKHGGHISINNERDNTSFLITLPKSIWLKTL